jgi:hypothetical protein
MDFYFLGTLIQPGCVGIGWGDMNSSNGIRTFANYIFSYFNTFFICSAIDTDGNPWSCTQLYGGYPSWQSPTTSPPGPPQSQTITHRTNIVNYSPEQIGTFCETMGEISDVYGINYVPTLERATDAIVKVKQCTSVNSKIMGIITKWNQFMTHGDGLCRVVDDTYTLGDILVPDETGLCRKASQEEALFCTINQIHLPRVSAKISNNAEIVAIFM